MQELQPRRKPRYAYSAMGITGGILLLWFELRNGLSAEGWFWMLVGGLMILLGIAGLFQRDETAPKN